MKRLLLIILCAVFFLHSPKAEAVSLITDEETETWLYDLLSPIFKAASLPLSRDYIHIIKDDSLNAFVGDRNNMFVHTGTLLKASTANELEGVLAHETGHILGGHILRLKIKMQDLQKATLFSLLAAGAAAAASGRGDAAIAVVLGSQSSAINAMTAYQVSEERAADETAALLLGKKQKSVKGLKTFMQKIKNENRLQGIAESPYFRTHPVTSERISFFDARLKKEPPLTPDKQMDQRLKRIQAKLFAFLSPVSAVIKKYPDETASKEAMIARAVVYMRQKNATAALKLISQLIAAEPNNPYFHELKAQTLFETGRLKEAVSAYKKTLSLYPSSALFKLAYAEAVLAAGAQKSELKSLIVLLTDVSRNNDFPIANHYLGEIYARLGDDAAAAYYAAEYNAALGEDDIARRQLARAQKGNLSASLKLRADDLAAKLKQQKKSNSLF